MRDPYPCPDYYVSRSSDVVKRRGSKGQTIARVIRHGTPWTAGPDTVSSTDPDETACARIVPRVADAMIATARRSRGGTLSGRDLVHIADVAYGPDELPPLLGLEPDGSAHQTSWSEVIPQDVADLVGASPWNPAAWTDGGTVAGHARPVLKRPSRLKLPRVRIRRSETRSATRTVVCDPALDVQQSFTVEHLPCPAADREHVWVGHRRIPRGRLAHRRDRKRARTIDYVNVEQTAEGLRGAADLLGKGQRVEIVTDRGTRFAITRSPGGRYSANLDGVQHRSMSAAGIATSLVK